MTAPDCGRCGRQMDPLPSEQYPSAWACLRPDCPGAVFKCPCCSGWQTGERVSVSYGGRARQHETAQGLLWCPPVCQDCVDTLSLTDDDIRQMWTQDREWDFNWTLHRLYGEQEGCCNGCKRRLGLRDLTLDHIKPTKHGGTDYWVNLQLLCYRCNSLKGTGSMEDLRARLARQEREAPPQPFRLPFNSNRD